jgi:hypothetical protein
MPVAAGAAARAAAARCSARTASSNRPDRSSANASLVRPSPTIGAGDRVSGIVSGIDARRSSRQRRRLGRTERAADRQQLPAPLSNVVSAEAAARRPARRPPPPRRARPRRLERPRQSCASDGIGSRAAAASMRSASQMPRNSRPPV